MFISKINHKILKHKGKKYVKNLLVYMYIYTQNFTIPVIIHKIHDKNYFVPRSLFNYIFFHVDIGTFGAA